MLGAVDSEQLERLFPDTVATALRRLPTEELPLEPEELPALTRAVAKRRRDFAAGRACAREALTKLGHAPVALPRMEDGRPRWPEGVIGAITHSTRWCAAAATSAKEIVGLGLDIEELGRLSFGSAARVLSSAELDATERRSLDADACRTVMFSAKESIYKCLYPLVLRYIDFDEAEIALGDEGRLEARLAPALEAQLPAASRLVGRYRVSSESVLTTMMLRLD
jgi:4'-phosphopantetheinyl transferase EntD